jgi:hypothetical protein
VAKSLEALIDAFKFGEEDRARLLVSQLGEGPEQIRTVLEAMLEDSHGIARQAAVFGLGELGGAAKWVRKSSCTPAAAAPLESDVTQQGGVRGPAQ